MAVDIKKIDRDTWLRSVFPEWGTYLNEEIEETKVPPKKFAMWWLTCCGVWIKTPAKVDIAIDFWVQRGEATKKQLPYKQIKDAQIVRMTGARKYPPFLRISPHVIDPFQVKKLDAVLSTHIHGDHICEFVAAAAVTIVNAEACRAPLPFRTFAGIPPIYGALRTAPNAVVVEMPLFDARSWAGNAVYMLNSTSHWKPLVNGYSGFLPASYSRLQAALAGFPGQEALETMHQRGITHVVVHEAAFVGMYGQARFDDIGMIRSLNEIARDGDIHIYKLH